MLGKQEKPFTIAMLALGGQGGGVLTKWLVDLAEHNDYLAQYTYIAGVAQRTGATVYCVEMFPKARAAALGVEPVFALYPVPGDVDLVIASELAETGRAIEKGFVTPNVTTLIASSHRVYSITEKMALGDGIADQAPVLRAARQAAQKFICFDMDAAANEAGSVISSVIFGAIAGCGALPIAREQFEATIRRAGRGVEASLRGFALGYERATQPDDAHANQAAAPRAKPAGPNGEGLQRRIESSLPAPVRDIALHGALRALDYQDVAYAETYLQRLEAVTALDSAAGGESHGFTLTATVAPQLALQMCYEDTIRVAQIKTQAGRMQGIRDDIGAEPEQPAYIVEYFHPRFEEICDTMPAGIGQRLLGSHRLRRWSAPFFRNGRNVQTNKITGFVMLYVLAKLRRWRRGTLRFAVQEQHLANWLHEIEAAVAHDYECAVAIADSIQIVMGYGDTYHRGLTRYRATLAAAATLPPEQRGETIRRLLAAALADEKGIAFDKARAELAPATL